MQKNLPSISFIVLNLVFFILISSILGDSRKIYLDLSYNEKKALKREMVEMDISIREFASAMALNHPQVASRRFQKLSSFQIAISPYYKKIFPSLAKKLQDQNLYNRFHQLHHEAKKAYNATKKYQQCDSECRNLFHLHYKKVLFHCSSCHSKVIMKNDYFNVSEN